MSIIVWARGGLVLCIEIPRESEERGERKREREQKEKSCKWNMILPWTRSFLQFTSRNVSYLNQVVVGRKRKKERRKFQPKKITKCQTVS
jgi:hypothetical protein